MNCFAHPTCTHVGPCGCACSTQIERGNRAGKGLVLYPVLSIRGSFMEASVQPFRFQKFSRNVRNWIFECTRHLLNPSQKLKEPKYSGGTKKKTLPFDLNLACDEEKSNFSIALATVVVLKVLDVMYVLYAPTWWLTREPLLPL